MSTDTVTIGCRLPNGIELEVGYETTVVGSGGAPYTRYRKLSDYKAVRLKGTGQHLILRDPLGKPVGQTLPGKRDAEPFYNHGVPVDFWQRWVSEHKDSPLLLKGQLFVVPKPGDTAAVTKDAKAISPNIFQPLDPTQPFKTETHAIEKRADDAD